MDLPEFTKLVEGIAPTQNPLVVEELLKGKSGADPILIRTSQIKDDMKKVIDLLLEGQKPGELIDIKKLGNFCHNNPDHAKFLGFVPVKNNKGLDLFASEDGSFAEIFVNTASANPKITKQGLTDSLSQAYIDSFFQFYTSFNAAGRTEIKPSDIKFGEQAALQILIHAHERKNNLPPGEKFISLPQGFLDSHDSDRSGSLDFKEILKTLDDVEKAPDKYFFSPTELQKQIDETIQKKEPLRSA